MDFPSNDSYFSLLNLSFVENCHISIFTTFAKQSMINRLSNSINRNRSAAKISKVMSSSDHSMFNEQTCSRFTWLFVCHHAQNIFEKPYNAIFLKSPRPKDIKTDIPNCFDVLGLWAFQKYSTIRFLKIFWAWWRQPNNRVNLVQVSSLNIEQSRLLKYDDWGEREEADDVRLP